MIATGAIIGVLTAAATTAFIILAARIRNDHHTCACGMVALPHHDMFYIDPCRSPEYHDMSACPRRVHEVARCYPLAEWVAAGHRRWAA